MTLELVLGGARSGKSALAEARVLAAGQTPAYIATAQVWDDEMRARIALHRDRRQGQGWETHEAPLTLAAVLRALPPAQPVLVDCLTLWLSNHLLADADLESEAVALLSALDRPGLTVLVAPVSERPTTRRL